MVYCLILETLEKMDGCCLDNDEERERVAEAVYYAVRNLLLERDESDEDPTDGDLGDEGREW